MKKTVFIPVTVFGRDEQDLKKQISALAKIQFGAHNGFRGYEKKKCQVKQIIKPTDEKEKA